MSQEQVERLASGYGLDIIRNDERYALLASRNEIAQSEEVIVSFTGIGHAMGGVNVQKIEFAGSARSRGGLVVVMDK